MFGLVAIRTRRAADERRRACGVAWRTRPGVVGDALGVAPPALIVSTAWNLTGWTL